MDIEVHLFATLREGRFRRKTLELPGGSTVGDVCQQLAIGAGEAARAVPHLQKAVEHDPNYSAAWKLLGKALADSNAPAEALAAYRQGIAVAEARGDKQAAKEMGVFARRISKQLGLEFDD